MEGVFALAVFAAIIIGLTLLVVKLVNRHRYKPYNSRLEALAAEIQQKYAEAQQMEAKCAELQQSYAEMNEKTRELQALADQGTRLASSVEAKRLLLQQIETKINSVQQQENEADRKIHAIQSKVDLYSRLDDFVDHGMYEMPDYLYETSERFALEIKHIREKQKTMIQDKRVIIATGGTVSLGDDPIMKRILAEQAKMMIRTFNIECDLLIGKVNPGNFQRTLERIDAIATSLEKSSADLQYGFNIEYVKLKYEECKLEYQFTVKKKEEQEEQRAIREQMREEERARREYEEALAASAKEESMYQSLLDKARQELEKAGEAERQAAELRIQQLEEELAEAKAKSERALSMAQQTKKGHVYVISNIGSFGENVYKIGLTRRLDPLDRVKELGDASVPFSFDVHAMIASDDAPALENQLHKEFDGKRVNAVNLKKEFFRVSLEDIRKKVEEITGRESDFVMTILAEEYYQTLRMRGE